MKQAVIYEVSAAVPPVRKREFEDWLRGHIPEVLAVPGFKRASLWEVQGDTPSWVVQYEVESRQALQRYLDEDAERMRQDGLRRFGEDLLATRRIYLNPTTFTP